MKIKREINGQMMEFELTEQELWDAHFEQQHNNDMENVTDALDDMIDERELMELCERRSVSIPDLVSEVVRKSREKQDSNATISECLWECIYDAIEEVVNND